MVCDHNKHRSSVLYSDDDFNTRRHILNYCILVQVGPVAKQRIKRFIPPKIVKIELNN